MRGALGISRDHVLHVVELEVGGNGYVPAGLGCHLRVGLKSGLSVRRYGSDDRSYPTKISCVTDRRSWQISVSPDDLVRDSLRTATSIRVFDKVRHIPRHDKARLTAAKAFHFRHSHAGHADFRQRSTNVV